MGASNVKAMREALETLLNIAHEVQDANSEYGPKTSVPTQFIIDTAKSALAAPPRNCDVGTPEERMCRYNRLREEINERYKRLGEIPPPFAFPTAFEWEDRPYEEGGADE